MPLPGTILVVGDNKNDLELLRLILADERVKVLRAPNGSKALALLKLGRVEAIISDTQMSEMDGFRLCLEVRSSPRHFATPFIFYAASAFPDDETFALEMGATKFINRTATTAEILDYLRGIAVGSAAHLMSEPFGPAQELVLLKKYIGRLESQLEQKNTRLQLQSTALDAAANAVVITDRQGTILWSNPAFTALTGYSAAEALGQNPNLLKSGRHNRRYYQHLWDAILAGKTWRGEFTNRRKDGNLYQGEQTITPVRSESGAITHFIGIMNDVTERKRLEQALHAKHAQLRQLLEHSPAVIYALRLEGQKVVPYLVSANITELLGFTVAETMSYEWWEGHLHPEDKAGATGSIAKTIEHGASRSEYRLRHIDGSYRWVEDNRRLIRGASGQPMELVGVWTNTTELKKLQAQILRQQRLESIGTLAGGIAHDLNNILTPILMSMQLFQLRFADEESRQIIERVDASARRGAAIVRQILTFARGGEGERVPLQLKRLISDQEKMCRETFPASIRFSKTVQEDLWTVMADATQLYQVLMNLCVNARDAMPDGGKLIIKAENLAIDEQYRRMNPQAKCGRYVVVTVSDTGKGMAPNILEKIFDPFFTTKEVGKGTGLGLSTVMGIVKSHEGWVNAHSEVGKGSQLRVYLPALESNRPGPTETTKPVPPVGHGELVLVVDDEKTIRAITKETLEVHGYRVLTASDGTEAIASYAQHPNDISLVITDMAMPFMDGPATIRALRKINPDLKIIAVSGMSENESIAQLAGGGNVSFLAKPFASEKLLVEMSKVLTG